MKRNACLAAVLLLTGFGTALSIPARAVAGSMPSSVQHETTKQLPPAVEKTMARLLSFEPDLKKLQMENSLTSTRTGITSIRMAEANNTRSASSAYIDIHSQTGELRSFTFQFQDRASTILPAASFAKEQAQQFLLSWFGSKQMTQFGVPVANGSGSSSVHHADHTESTWAHRTVEFPLLINGIPTSTGGVGPRMDIDSSGRIIRFEYNPPPLSHAVLPDPTDVLNPDILKKRLFTPERVTLSYVERQPSRIHGKIGSQTGQPVLRYDMRLPAAVNAFTGKAVDLVTGEQQNESGSPFEMWKAIPMSAAPYELRASSRKEAARILLEICNVDVSGWRAEDQERKMTRLEQPDETVAYMWWNDDASSSANVIVDRTSGRVLHANVTGIDLQKGTTSKEEAFEKAATFIQTYVSASSAPMQVSHFHSRESDAPPFWADNARVSAFAQENRIEEHQFRFTEQQDGVPIMDRSSFVTVNTAGRITGFSLSPHHSATVLPSASSLVSRTDAARTFYENTQLKLEYLWPDYFGQRAPSPVLVYRISSPIPGDAYIDARTGAYTTVPFESEN